MFKEFKEFKEGLSLNSLTSLISLHFPKRLRMKSPRCLAPRDDGGVCPRDDGKSESPRNGCNTMWVLKKVPSPTQVTWVLKIIPAHLTHTHLPHNVGTQKSTQPHPSGTGIKNNTLFIMGLFSIC